MGEVLTKMGIANMMNRTTAFAVLAAATFLTAGCNAVMGGPGNDDIVNIAREQMIKTAPSPELQELAKTAELAPRGMCNHIEDKYACIVTVKTSADAPDAKPTDMVVELKKDASGNWVGAD